MGEWIAIAEYIEMMEDGHWAGFMADGSVSNRLALSSRLHCSTTVVYGMYLDKQYCLVLLEYNDVTWCW